MDLEKVYSKLPIFIQNQICSLVGLKNRISRYPRDYKRIFEELKNNNDLDKSALKDLQQKRMSRHLQAAVNCDYWAEKFEEFQVDVYAEDALQEVQKLPILTKKEVQLNCERILNPTFPQKDLNKLHTSGTTGAGLVFWDTKQANYERWAVWWRYRNLHGITFDTKCGYFGGRSIVPVSQKKPPYWRYNKPENQILFSAYHLSQDTIADYLAAFNEYNPEWLHGYPSQLSLFANLIEEHFPNFDSKVKIITIGAENLFSHQKEVLERVFKCPVIQHYGLQESVANISQCENLNLHVDEDLGYVEFIPKGDSYRIIGTNWSNPAFPLFRYDTNDLCELPDTLATCNCGSNGRLVSEINGRNEDYVTLPSGVKLGRLDHIFKDLNFISEAQIVQHQDYSITIKVVPLSVLSDQQHALLIEAAQKRLSDEVRIDVDIVAKIPKQSSGKLKFVISEI